MFNAAQKAMHTENDTALHVTEIFREVNEKNWKLYQRMYQLTGLQRYMYFLYFHFQPNKESSRSSTDNRNRIGLKEFIQLSLYNVLCKQDKCYYGAN